MKFNSTFDTVTLIIEKIKNEEFDAYIRFGDGDFNLIEGRGEQCADPSTELSVALKATIKSKAFKLKSLNIHCQNFGTVEEGMRPGIFEIDNDMAARFLVHWRKFLPDATELHSATALHQQIIKNPSLIVSLLKAIKKHKVLFIGNEYHLSKKKILEKLFGNTVEILLVPPYNSFSSHDKTMQMFDKTTSDLDENYFIVVLAAGCGGRAMVPSMIRTCENHNKKMFILDAGSFLDSLLGNHERAWIKLSKCHLHLNELVLNQI